MEDLKNTSSTKSARMAQHKKEAGKEIILPGILILVVFIAAAFGFSYLSMNHPVGMHKAANYLTSILFFILFIITLAISFLMFFFSQQVVHWKDELPDSTDLANQKIESVRPVVEDILNKAADPYITAESKIKAFLDYFKSKKHTETEQS